MSNSIFLSLVFNNHQPAGNFDFVNEHSFRTAYLPMVELLQRYPGIHVGMHFSGSLLEWLGEHHPELLDQIRALVERGQVEILSGGYYAPVLASLRDVDKQGQIDKLTKAVKRRFGADPAGIWLAERVWDPYLAKPLAEAGAKYTIVDDTHFEAAGFNKHKELFGYYITEEQGEKLAIFPTLTRLRYSIPWGSVEDNINWLRDLANGGDGNQPRLVFMGEDGEKFGGWPGTHEHCWQNGYMESLFEAIQANSEWLHTTTPADYMANYPALGRAYLPTGSYMEMGEWSLPSALEYDFHNIVQDLQREKNEHLLRFVRGGTWRNFMVKYEEINRMHKRALHISKLVHAMPEGQDKNLALDLLWAAQSNDAYWHGVFGGIYLFHFRVTNYANLIAAEMLAEGEQPPLKVEKVDINLDNNQELMLRSNASLMIFDLAHGGVLKEWDHRPARYNLLNLMTRRDEGYHQDLLAAAAEGRVVVVEDQKKTDYEAIPDGMVEVKEAGIERYLIADWYCRGAFVDHFLRNDSTLEGFYRSAYPEQGDYILQPYEAEWELKGDTATVHLSRDGNVWMGENHLPVRVSKNFTIKEGQNSIAVDYKVSNLSEQVISARFGIETALAYDGGAKIEHCAFELDGERLCLADVAAHEGITAYGAVTAIRDLRTMVTLSRPSNLWRFPLETVNLSEAGYERSYQGTAFLHWWPLYLEPGQEWVVSMTMDSTLLG